ncbi:hypothetical protein [Mesobacillus subterraneus]|nr:hypothetical protein [Mesobacillus subterraneus]
MGVPIGIFKNGEFLKECSNIQEAGSVTSFILSMMKHRLIF